MMVLPVLAIVAGYLLGSIPSAYLVGRFWGKIDLRQQGDSHVSATAVYREMGRSAFIVVIIMDAAKGVLAVYLAKQLGGSSALLAAAAGAAVVGHCWSVFIGFKGGLGAVVTYGVLFALARLEFFIGVAVAVVVFLATRRSTLSTYVLLVTASLVLLLEKKDLVVVILPLSLILVQILKRFQSRRATGYRDDLLDDLKRSK